jgi:hypothetical protein
MTRHRDSRVLLIALVLPIALTAVSLGILLAWLPQLPPTVALHWGTGGADGFGPSAMLPGLLAVFAFGVPVLLGGIVILTPRETFGFGQKLLSTLSLATTVLLVVTFLVITAQQRGLDDPRQAPGISPTLLIGFAAAVVVGVGAWFILPKWSPVDPSWRAAEPLALARDERAVWLGTARFPIGIVAAILVPTLAVGAISSWAAAQRGGPAWLLLAVPVVMVLAVLGSVDWRIRVDAGGLQVRSLLGVPRWRIPLADIAEVGTTSVAGLAEFGGWGLRWAGRGRIGIITRSGPALEVRCHDGSSLTITVDDAASAAALLTARVGAQN